MSKEEVAKEYIKALTEVGNMKSVMKACEPNVMQPQKLEEWMVLRTMTAFTLFQQELDKHG